MMNKLEIAHQYFMQTMGFIRNNNIDHNFDDVVSESWDYVDAMQAESDEREINIEEIMKDHKHDFIYGRVCACGKVKDVEEEWQPDYSKAPEWANWWAICSRGQACWYGGEPERSEAGWGLKHDSYPFHTTTSFNYQYNWRDSLRKCP